ncbi:hypothetical protein A5765_20120 [Mycolicibacterium celeriflavum]|nr:hypothetical protein A5765_20120 [Mycolicibacterium celeriflavum]
MVCYDVEAAMVDRQNRGELGHRMLSDIFVIVLCRGCEVGSSINAWRRGPVFIEPPPLFPHNPFPLSCYPRQFEYESDSSRHRGDDAEDCASCAETRNGHHDGEYRDPNREESGSVSGSSSPRPIP